MSARTSYTTDDPRTDHRHLAEGDAVMCIARCNVARPPQIDDVRPQYCTSGSSHAWYTDVNSEQPEDITSVHQWYSDGDMILMSIWANIIIRTAAYRHTI